MKDKPFIVLAGLFFMLLVGGLTMFALTRPGESTILRAKNAAVSPLKSFAIIFPQVGPVGTKMKVTITLRDVSGSILPNRSVQISSQTPGIIVSPTDTQSTNENGQAEFFVTSASPGNVQIKATELSGNISIVNIPSIEFTP